MEKLKAIIYLKNRDFEGKLIERLQDYYDIDFVTKLRDQVHEIKFPPAATEGILMQPGVIYLEFYNPAYERKVLLHGWSSRQIFYGILKTNDQFSLTDFKVNIPKLNISKDSEKTYKVNFPAITKELMLKQEGVESLTYQHGGKSIKELGQTTDDATSKMMEDLGLSQWGVSLPKVLQKSKAPSSGDIQLVATDPDQPVIMTSGEVMQLPNSPQKAVQVVEASKKNNISPMPSKGQKPLTTQRNQASPQTAPSMPQPELDKYKIPLPGDGGTKQSNKQKGPQKDDGVSDSLITGLKWAGGIALSAWIGKKIFS